MKKYYGIEISISLTLLILFLISCFYLGGPQRIQWSEANEHIGENVIVRGKVSLSYNSIGHIGQAGGMYIFFDESSSSKSNFFIYQRDHDSDEKVASLKNKVIEVKGQIKNYKNYLIMAPIFPTDNPRRENIGIRITDFTQIKIIEESKY